MRVRRVAVVFHESLMLEGLVALLEERDDMEVTSVDPTTVDVGVSLSQLSPEVIILDGESLDEWPDLTLPRLLYDNRLAKVVDVNPHRNEIRIYEQHQVSVGKFDDLLDALETPAGRAMKGGKRVRKSV